MVQNRRSIFLSLLYLYFACLILILPLRWLLGWVFALAVHELGHWLAVVICGGKVVSLSAVPGGLDMVATPMTSGQRFICIIFGPLIGVVPVLLRGWFPELAVFSLLLTVYNLIPVRPLDGGRLLELLLGKYKKLYFALERLILGAIFAFCIGLSVFHKLGLLPVAVAAELVLKNRKIACKRGVGAVQ